MQPPPFDSSCRGGVGIDALLLDGGGADPPEPRRPMLAEDRAHLDLRINLLTEHKVA